MTGSPNAGGSNSYRYRLWKAELATLAAETGLDITVCHFPPGTSKWNKVEHRLFSHITLNWRGRPLTSHEVVVQTIATTRTSTGLRVAAQLDTGVYPLGVAVSKADMLALPLAPHSWCGSWNYTIGSAAKSTDQRPPEQQGSSRTGVGGSGQAHTRDRALEVLSDPRLTGIDRHELDTLAADLAPAQAAQTAQRCYKQRGGRRRRAPGAGSRSLLSDAARVLITIVYLRQICSQSVLSEILGVNPNWIGQAIAETRQLLDERGHTISPTTLRFTTPKALTDFLDGAAIARRPSLPEALSVPTLTGMPRPELDAMIERLSDQQAAHVERRRYRRRGAERLPGARGGVFLQKITDPERILATVLYQRKVCTRQALAELFDVSARTIGAALIEVRPLLEQDGYVATPTPGPRFPTAAAVLASLEPTGPPDTEEPPC
jgi:Rhodopirellula transposase DDE domain